MSIGLVHLSDIHFGQEKGGQMRIHDDVKESLIEDVGLAVKDLEAGRASGIIVTGDIAFGGRQCEYAQAAAWLDRVTDAAGCDRTSIQVVPGNHDIDRSQITKATGMMLDRIAEEGEAALDEFLEEEADREMLFGVSPLIGRLPRDTAVPSTPAQGWLKNTLRSWRRAGAFDSSGLTRRSFVRRMTKRGSSCSARGREYSGNGPGRSLLYSAIIPCIGSGIQRMPCGTFRIAHEYSFQAMNIVPAYVWSMSKTAGTS